MSLTMLESSRLDRTITLRRAPGVLLAGVSGRLQGGIRRVLSRCRASVECFATVEDCLAVLDRRPYDLLVVCLDDEQDGGFELVKQAKSLYPSTPILALVKAGDVSLAVRVMKAGATDCLETSVEVAALRFAILGLHEQYRAGKRNANPGLTQTESLVLSHMLEGRTNREVAERLHRSPRTIEVHRRAIMHKLGASGTVDLVKRASSLGLMAPRDPRSTQGGVQSRSP